jgi:hypothetical protein
MRWAGQVTIKWERRNGYRVLEGNLKRSLGTDMWKDNLCGS